MGVTIRQEDGNLKVLLITGLLKKSELDAVLAAEARQWDPATRIQALIIVEDFEGWERNADWGDTSFFFKHDDQIVKVAIVADRKWETDFLMFLGAGIRRAPVKFFPPHQLSRARTWLG